MYCTRGTGTRSWRVQYVHIQCTLQYVEMSIRVNLISGCLELKDAAAKVRYLVNTFFPICAK